MQKTKLAIFASGRGSNARAIIDFALLKDRHYVVSLILSNKKSAGVIDLAQERNIPHSVFNKKEFYDTYSVLDVLKEHKIDHIALAGFLWLIPSNLVKAFPEKIINIHPALLPKYGGKGMYGIYVHQAVAEAGDPYSGITIHHVNEHYDEGDIIFQSRIQLSPDDTPEEIAARVLQLEHHFYPWVIDGLCARSRI